MALLLGGCGSQEVLVERSAVVPAGLDLSGRWQLAEESRDTTRRLLDAEVAAAGGRGDILEFPPAENSRRDRGSLVHVFLETGTNLKITQTAYALFVSFDRAIVEEYRYGEYAEVSVGPVVAKRSSGWDEGAYVIETLDRKGNKLHERYQLTENGRLLMRQISIFRRKALTISLVQKFERLGE